MKKGSRILIPVVITITALSCVGVPKSIYAEGVASNQNTESAMCKEEVTKNSFVKELRQEAKSNNEEVKEIAKQN